jgi:hypothetical protein
MGQSCCWGVGSVAAATAAAARAHMWEGERDGSLVWGNECCCEDSPQERPLRSEGRAVVSPVSTFVLSVVKFDVVVVSCVSRVV